MTDRPATLGGKPAFEEPFPIIRPSANEAATDVLGERVTQVLQSNMLSNVGIYVRQFEEELEHRLGVDHAIAVSSCTLGLVLTLHALGIKNGEVAQPSFTFNATGLAAYWNNDRIRYVDIDESWTLNPERLGELGNGVNCLLPVHIYGNPCAVDALGDWAAEEGIPVVYDAAHALGSTLSGRAVGSFGTAEVFSLSPTKLITTGEGGVVATNDERLARDLRLLRNYGNNPDYTCDTAGLNARMSELNAVLGLEMLAHLDRYVANRNRYVERYRQRLASIPGVGLQRMREGARSSHKDFGILVDPGGFGLNRDELAKALEAEGILTKRYFFPALHELEAFPPADSPLPVTDRVAQQVLSLPIHNTMAEEDVDRVAERISLIQVHALEVREALGKA